MRTLELSGGLNRLLIFLLLLSVPPAVAQTSTPPRHGSTVSYTPLFIGGQDTRLPLISVRLNDKIDTALLVDTGASVSLLSQSTARRLGLPILPTEHDGKSLPPLTISRLNIGSLALSGVPFIVAPDVQVAALLGTAGSGILGTDLLSRFAVFFDFPQRRLTLLDPGAFLPSDLQALDLADASVVSLRDTFKNGYPHWSVAVRLHNGRERSDESLVLDTGTVSTNISRRTARRLKLRPTQEGIKKLNFQSSDVVNTATVTSLELGDFLFDNVPVDYPVSETSAYTSLLGMDVLSSFRILIDFAGHKMYLAPATGLPASTTDGNQQKSAGR